MMRLLFAFLLVTLLFGCKSSERDIKAAFDANMPLSSEWKLYEENDQKTIYVNVSGKKGSSPDVYEFQMMRKIKNFDDHKAFVSILNKEPKLGGLNFDKFSYMKSDEAINCSNGKWITVRYHILDSDGTEIASMDGADIDDTVFQITPKLYDMVCK